MDAGKVHALLTAFEGRRLNGQHIDVADRKIVEEIRNTPFLDRVDIHVYVQYPSMIAPVWENYEGVAGYEVNDGVLSVLVGGNDADGEWGTVQVVCWPRGQWLKFQTELTPVDNPYCEIKEAEEEEADNAGE